MNKPRITFGAIKLKVAEPKETGDDTEKPTSSGIRLLNT